MSRPAISQHLRVLKRANLVTDHAEGTRRLYSVNPEALLAAPQFSVTRPVSAVCAVLTVWRLSCGTMRKAG